MPLVYQHNINEGTKLGVWHIKEPDIFFLERVPLKKDVSHPHKRLQHLAGRYLLTVLFDDFPLEEILIADTRKPFLENEQYHFSISHCGDYVAAIVSKQQRVGVDIELVTPKIERVKQKFLSEEEWQLAIGSRQSITGNPQPADAIANDLLTTDNCRLLTILWSAKEAIYKWYGSGQLDFKKHIQLKNIEQQTGELIRISFLFRKNIPATVALHARLLNGLSLAWLVTAPVT